MSTQHTTSVIEAFVWNPFDNLSACVSSPVDLISPLISQHSQISHINLASAVFFLFFLLLIGIQGRVNEN